MADRIRASERAFTSCSCSRTPYDRRRLQDPTLLAKYSARLKEQGDLFPI